MHIENGILKNDDGKAVRWATANSSGGSMTPRFVCLHDTAGSLRKFSSVEWFVSKECKTSAHFVIERDGTITQLVATNKKAFHAGQSFWKGVSGLNSCSVGIEIVNPGKLNEKGEADFGKVAEPSEIIAKKTTAHGSGWWLPYTQEQISAVIALCRALVEEYPDCNEIVTHYEIAPKRKIDVGPQFPLEEVRNAVFNPTVGEVTHLEETTPAVKPPAAPSMIVEGAKSTSSWGLLGTIGGFLADALFDVGTWVKDRIGDVVEVLKSTQTEADDVIAPLVSLGQKAQFNLGYVAKWVVIATLIVVLIRHIQKRVELAHVKNGTNP